MMSSTNLIFVEELSITANSSNTEVSCFRGEDEVNILTEFYSQVQKPEESEEAFTDELQLLAHKVISKCPAFREGLDTTLKQCYTNQLYDHNSTSITKTLLIQMPMVTFTQFHNELAWILGTHQCKDKNKSVTTSQVEADSGEAESIPKSHLKHDVKIAQSSQIQDLHSQLDAAVAENLKMYEYLDPSTLQAAVTNVLQAAQSNSCGHGTSQGFTPRKVGLFWVGLENHSSWQVRTGLLIPTKPVGTAKIQGMTWRTVCTSSARRISKHASKQDRGQTKGSCSWGSWGEQKLTQPFLYHLCHSAMSYLVCWQVMLFL